MCEREYTAQEIVELLRRCGTDNACAGCQMYVVTGCEAALKGYAADTICRLLEENKTMFERCQVQQNEINALVLKLGKQEDKTNQPPAWNDLAGKVSALISQASYQEGRADALEAFIARYFFEEVHPNE